MKDIMDCLRECCEKIIAFFRKPFFSDYRTILLVWIVMCLVVAITKSYNSDNNFRIFTWCMVSYLR